MGARGRLVGGVIVIAVVALGAAPSRDASGARREHGACATPATPRVTDSTSSALELGDKVDEQVEVLQADVDGDGCVDPVLRIGPNVLQWNGVRFAVGSAAAGDVALVGDWDCDGVATAAAWRRGSESGSDADSGSESGVMYVFSGWAAPGEDLPAARRVELSRRPGGDPPTPCPTSARPRTRGRHQPAARSPAASP